MNRHRLTRVMGHRLHVTIAVGSATATLVATGCTDGYEALGAHTAHVSINGSDTGVRPPISCEQVQWVWFIETLNDDPGFTAQVRTGDTVTARLVRINNLGGFTGSAWNASVTVPEVEADANVRKGTFKLTGTAIGFYRDSPADTTTATFEIRTDC